MINTIAAIVCFLASMFFACICYSLRNYRRHRLAFLCRSRKNEARFGQILKEDEPALLACELAGIAALAVALVLAAFIRSWHHADHITSTQLWGFLVTAAVVSWLAVRLFPWALSRVAAEPILYRSWPLIRGVSLALRPLVKLAGRIDTLVHRAAGRSDPQPDTMETFTQEIQSVVDEGERAGVLESRAGRMIQRVMELRLEDIRAVMTPRTDIISISVECTLDEARDRLLEAGHSRIPVIEGTPDEIAGILYARDLLESLAQPEPRKSLREIVRAPFYVPETTTVDALLERMKRERMHLAIVLDEYGGVTGLVTLEDILEEIVGDIADEFDEREEALYQVVDPHTLRVDARMHLDELNELFDLSLPEDRDFDTIGGFVFSELGRIPSQGERLEWQGLRILVLEATPRKLIRLELSHNVAWPVSGAPSAEQQVQ